LSKPFIILIALVERGIEERFISSFIIRIKAIIEAEVLAVLFKVRLII
jgi:hypothetical protein